MKALRVPLVVGFVAGMLAANCGGKTVDPKTLNGTALFVTCFFNADYKVRQLVFSGDTAGGNDAFTTGARPDPASTTDLKGPLTARILLNDALAGDEVALTVYALDVNGEVVESGYQTAKVALGTETDVRVDLAPFTGGPPDAGPGVDAGGFDAGTLDAGFRSDGGTGCDCTSGCCIFGANPDGGSCAPVTQKTFPLGNDGTTPPLTVTAQFCGRSGFACTLSDFCDPLRANTCAGAKCVCGNTGAACPPGTRCAMVQNAFTCVCDRFSDCTGCCNGQSQCVVPLPDTCGAAGLGCQKCVSATGVAAKCEGQVWGVGACGNFAGCLTCTKVNECCSGNNCVNPGFPTCRQASTGSPSVCASCDVLKANGCHWKTGLCACGDGGSCGPGETCEEGTCRRVF